MINLKTFAGSWNPPCQFLNSRLGVLLTVLNKLALGKEGNALQQLVKF